MPTVSFIRTVATRAVFLRRMSPTCIAASFRFAQEHLYRCHLGIHYANCQFESRRPKREESGSNTDVYEGSLRCLRQTNGLAKAVAGPFVYQKASKRAQKKTRPFLNG